ncbi:L,D-transpeptidase catalytic domain [Hymenobacter daecheongensis DSM 21074]|uniref:L,D-transpeptidase catalytic domain n=1 Tax=Hymenobacter daecheongensis DSM 21074 TaxID=1121955 RepID=A0A1M6CH96_9BACT|nr:L,D-transpeptidase family protein [Hymenobacter daecheongensis]SHI60068.1 L,D-transpeptidase catalytic domain [Hymenobacter daecheongensis DSM 21074]
MKKALLALTLALVVCAARPATPTFRDEQLQHPRVRAAYARQWPALRQLLSQHHIEPGRLEVFIRAFKIGRRVEVWGRNQGEAGFQPLRTYRIAACSGALGPKRQEGDGQVPEGVYHINRFHPNSLYHLSLGLDYPNAADRALGNPKPGGDIFLHGSNVSIGCLPLTDALIEELYVLLVEARTAGQLDIPVHIFPFELNEEMLARYRQHRHYAFWRSLQPVYAEFEEGLKAGSLGDAY